MRPAFILITNFRIQFQHSHGSSDWMLLSSFQVFDDVCSELAMAILQFFQVRIISQNI